MLWNYRSFSNCFNRKFQQSGQLLIFLETITRVIPLGSSVIAALLPPRFPYSLQIVSTCHILGFRPAIVHYCEKNPKPTILWAIYFQLHFTSKFTINLEGLEISYNSPNRNILKEVPKYHSM